ncbi:MAG: hypothetical protein VW371_02410 [Bacteroidota bacterium]
MKLKLRVILNVKTDVLRDIIIDSKVTLKEMSSIITESFGFDSTEISTFHHTNEDWELLEEIKIFKIDESDISMENSPMSNFLIFNGDKIIFIYDFLNYWTFFIELFDIDESIEEEFKFKCINSIGTVPSEAPSDIYNSTDQEIEDNSFDNDDSLTNNEL